MKKIIAFAMSALLAVSAVALPVSAQPHQEIADVDLTQIRPVSAQELARIQRLLPEETIAQEEAPATQSIAGLPTTEQIQSVDNGVAVASSQQVEAPVPAYVTADTVILEYREGYEYRVYRSGTSGSWKTTNIFTGLIANKNYICQQRLAGQSETESTTVWVTTKDRSPCSVTPAEPVVVQRAGTFVELLKRDGYEYRVDDGQWQNVPIFRSLEPGKEYVFYQRIKETTSEYASEATELKVTTRLAGPSADGNLSKLAQYVRENGFENDQGFPTIAYSIQIDDTNDYYFLLTYDGIYLRCNTFNISEDASFVAFDTYFSLVTSGNMFPEMNLALVQDGYCIEEVEANGDSVYAENYQDNQMEVYHSDCDYFTDAQISQFLNSTVTMTCALWDEIIYSAFGFGLRGLGYLRYDGYGELFCSFGSGFHLGELVLEEDRAAGCVINGYSGNRYCSVCNGQILEATEILYAKGSHEYDNDCDRDCNVCGEQRCIRHIYSFACDVSCDICGEVRTDPLAAHSYSNRICVCGHENKLPGDVSGDGKVNMGDVSRVYAHSRGRTLITDSGALAAADTNGDGKVNMGDVSRVYAHITGKRPLTQDS